MIKKYFHFVNESLLQSTDVNYNNGWYSLNFNIKDVKDYKITQDFGYKIPIGVYGHAHGDNLIEGYSKSNVTGSLVSRDNTKLKLLLENVKEKEFDILSNNSVVYVGGTIQKILLFDSFRELYEMFDLGVRFTPLNVNQSVIQVTKNFYDSLEDKTIQHEDIPKTDKIYTVFVIKSMEMYKEEIVCLVDVTYNVDEYLSTE